MGSLLAPAGSVNVRSFRAGVPRGGPLTYGLTRRDDVLAVLRARAADTIRRLTVRVFPAPPALVRPGAGRQLAAVADRLAARRRFGPAASPSDSRAVGGRLGTLRTYGRPGRPGRTLRTWVSLDQDAVLRVVVLEGRPGDAKLFDRLLDRIEFPSLDG